MGTLVVTSLTNKSSSYLWKSMWNFQCGVNHKRKRMTQLHNKDIMYMWKAIIDFKTTAALKVVTKLLITKDSDLREAGLTVL